MTIKMEDLSIDQYGNFLCPLCPPPRASNIPIPSNDLVIRYEQYVPFLEDGDFGPEQTIFTYWRIECSARHVLVNSLDIYEDNENPPKPTLEVLRRWFNDREIPCLHCDGEGQYPVKVDGRPTTKICEDCDGQKFRAA